MSTDELHAHKKEELSRMNQLLSQIRTLQDNVNALNEEKEFNDRETARSSGMPHVPSQPSRIPSSRGVSAATLACSLLHGIQWVHHYMFLKNHLETWRGIWTRTAKFNNTDSTIFQES